MKKFSEMVSSAAIQALTALANNQFNARRYREAAELYKKLLQSSNNPEWRQNLGTCYLQRSLSLAAKGQIKEALTLWENYSRQSAPPYEHFDHYLLWLIQAKQQEKTTAALKQLSVAQLDQQYPALASLLGGLIITGQTAYQHHLPQDSVFIAHLKIVQTSLQALREHDLQAATELLRALPYRSAFRDFRSILKGVSLLSSSLEEARKSWAAVHQGSVYAGIAALLMAVTLPGAELAEVLPQLTQPQCRWLGKVLGWNKAQQELAEQLNKQLKPLSDKQQFKLAIEYQGLFGKDLVGQFCLSLLPSYAAGESEFKRHFPDKAAEELRIKALYEESLNHDGTYYWRQYIRALPENYPERELKIALILRRLASMETDHKQVDLLIESLGYDPDDRESYSQVLKFYQNQFDNSANYPMWLERTLERFPEDPEFLAMAMQLGRLQKNHQQTRDYASAVLKTDPLNTAARQTLFSSYLWQARQLIKTKAYPAVEEQLQLAENLKMGQEAQNQIELVRSFLHFAGQDKIEGMRLINAALQILNDDPVNYHFQAALEALLTGQPVATVLKGLPALGEDLMKPQAVKRLSAIIQDYAQEPNCWEFLVKALDKIKPLLKKSVTAEKYNEELLLSLCHTLDSIGHFELLRYCTKHAHSRWRFTPMWVYYKIYAETNGNPATCTKQHSYALEYNRQEAQDNKDYRIVQLIENYLNGYYEAHPEQVPLFSELTEFGPPDPNDPFEKLFGQLPDEVFHKLDKEAAKLAKKISPERFIKDLDKLAVNSQKFAKAVLNNPDLFSALLIFKAAEQLNIDIDLTIQDIFDAFDAGKSAGPNLFNFLNL